MNMKIGTTESFILDSIRENGTLCFPLIDSQNQTNTSSIVNKLEHLGATGILIGGSSVSDQIELSNIVAKIKSLIKIPVILFPGNITGIVPGADAILFSSLLNSENPYYITGAQAQGALIIKKYNLEAIPTAYLIIGQGSTAWFLGQTRSIPFDKSGIAIMYALAAQYMGMRFLYLEAGSGSSAHVCPEMISAVRAHFDGILIVGGGITDAETATTIANAGADILVVGTLIEKKNDWEEQFSKIISSIRK
jgi:phosphoglycerol geranylgeranyltransferase